MSRPRIARLSHFVAALLIAAHAAHAQRPAPAAISLEVRSTTPDQVVRVQVSAYNGAAFGLAVWNGAPGSVAQAGNTGSGTTPLIVSVTKTVGRVRLAVAEGEPPIRVTIFGDTAKPPTVLGTGRVLDIVRDSLGKVTVTPGK